MTGDQIFDKLYNKLRRKMDRIEGIKDKEQAGDFIYELAEALYKDEAGKITGMILEFEMDKLINMIMEDPRTLKELITNGHKLIQIS